MAGAALTTAAWVAHDLGLTASVGGSLFGRVALGPAVKNIPDKERRGMVVKDAWKSFNGVQLAGVSVMALTWLVGRTLLSGRELGRAPRALVLAKDALVAGTLISAVGSSVTGKKLASQRPGGAVPVEGSYQVSAQASPEAKRLGRLTGIFGIANIVCGAGVMALTTILAMNASRKARWKAVTRVLV